MLNKIPHILFLVFIFLTGAARAENNKDPIIINATMTATDITLSPAVIPENIPFIIHVLNKAGVPVELENSDTSVEVYADMDKTFKVGLTAGSYVFFNDFNPHSKTATLAVKTAAELATTVNHSNSVLSTPSPTQQARLAPSSSHFEDSEILFIIWRESVEALLVVGIVYSWLKQLKQGRRTGMLFLWLGVAIGLFCATFLSFILVRISGNLSSNAATYFQAAMTLIAATMIVYMVKWMRDNARKLKAEMQNALGKNSSTKWRNISILTVVAVAVAREASEAAIFIYALGFERSSEMPIKMTGILALGVILAMLTIYLLQLGNKIFSWRFFFKITEVLLLLLGGGLLLNCVDLLIATGSLPALFTKVWDTSFLVGNGGLFAPMLASFTGYRATPSLMDILVYSTYWLAIYWLLKTKKDKAHAK
jgi:high-affinity iron transporter